MIKKIIPIIILLMMPLLSAEIATADIQALAWINPVKGEDPYYGGSVVAYKEGTTWNLSISVFNDYRQPPSPGYQPVNITAIKVYFDWGAWYNYTFEEPVYMRGGEVKVFSVYNFTPSLSTAPETWTYSYTVYVYYVPSLTPSSGLYWEWHGGNFAVMSEAHFDSFQLYNKLKEFMMFGLSFPMVNSTKAQVLFVRAYMEYTLGLQHYRNGAFEDARTHLQNADSYFSEALTAWEEKGVAFEDAMLEYYNSLAEAEVTKANAEVTQANAALNNSYGWIFFGIGWILIGIGIIVYGAKKPKAI